MIHPPNTFAADPKSLDTLRERLRNEPDQGRAEVGRQFESLFIQIMLKNMRSATISPGATDSDQSQFYQELFDTQISQQLAQGQGLGLGEQVTRQLHPAPARPSAKAAAPGLFENLTLNRPTLTPPAHTVRPVSPAAFTAFTAAPLRSTHASDHAEPAPRARSVDPAYRQPQPAAPARDVITTRIASDAERVDWPPNSPEAFIDALWPHAQRAAEDLGVSPKVLLAQAALESGWGKRQIRHPDGRTSFNLFGIKAGRSWDGERVRVSTLEYTGAVSERRLEQFRAYDSLSDAFADYVRLLKNNPRYQDALSAGKDHGAFADALQRAGYATDPNYAAKIKRIMATRLAHLDQPEPGASLV